VASTLDQIYQHLGTIFIGWMAVLGAVALTAAFTKRRWLERISIVVGTCLTRNSTSLSCRPHPVVPCAVLRGHQHCPNAEVRRWREGKSSPFSE
jgi:hypothetical protein